MSISHIQLSLSTFKNKISIKLQLLSSLNMDHHLYLHILLLDPNPLIIESIFRELSNQLLLISMPNKEISFWFSMTIYHLWRRSILRVFYPNIFNLNKSLCFHSVAHKTLAESNTPTISVTMIIFSAFQQVVSKEKLDGQDLLKPLVEFKLKCSSGVKFMKYLYVLSLQLLKNMKWAEK